MNEKLTNRPICKIIISSQYIIFTKLKTVKKGKKNKRKNATFFEAKESIYIEDDFTSEKIERRNKRYAKKRKRKCRKGC